VIFIDTGAFLARYIVRDQHHTDAVAFWGELADSGTACFTSNLVLSETFTLLARRTHYKFAAERARQTYLSNVLQILRPYAKDEAAGVFLFDKFADQQVRFCDCVSFALMRRLRIPDAFTFDAHFGLAGFNICP
jgi:predicted nucleic acid-binding protein